MLRGVSGNAPKKFMMVRKIHRENDFTIEDPSFSGNEAQICHRKIGFESVSCEQSSMEL
jgi:hypothetical protein